MCHPGDSDYAAFETDMGNFLSSFFNLDYQSENLAEVKDWLATTHDFRDYTVPVALASHPSLGCEKIDWNGHEVYLICFNIEDEIVHLFSFPEGTNVADAPTADGPGTFRQVGKWATTSWQKDGQVYLISTRASQEFLKKTLKV